MGSGGCNLHTDTEACCSSSENAPFTFKHSLILNSGWVFCFFPQPFNTRSTEFVAVGSVVLLISLSLKGQKGMKLQ